MIRANFLNIFIVFLISYLKLPPDVNLQPHDYFTIILTTHTHRLINSIFKF